MYDRSAVAYIGFQFRLSTLPGLPRSHFELFFLVFSTNRLAVLKNKVTNPRRQRRRSPLGTTKGHRPVVQHGAEQDEPLENFSDICSDDSDAVPR